MQQLSTIQVFCSIVHGTSKINFSVALEHLLSFVNLKLKNDRVIVSKAIHVQVMETLPTEHKYACSTKQPIEEACWDSEVTFDKFLRGRFKF